MIWRAAQASDLEECFAIEPRHLGGELLGEAAARTVWKRTLLTPSFNSTVVEDSVDGTPTIVAFGASVFCTPESTDRELHSPRPFLNSRVLHGVHSGRSPIATDGRLTSASLSAPLDLLLLSGSFRRDGIRLSQLHEAQMLLPLSLTELHKGYPIGRILTETVHPEQETFIERSGVWQRVATFPELSRTLTMMTAETVLRTSGSVSAALFQYKAPRLGLRPIERQLLAAAVHGATDHELATRLHLSADTIKKRWRTIFDRVAATLPSLLGSPGEADPDHKRGSQKRHHVLSYIRAHPEEVRPFRWYPQP